MQTDISYLFYAVPFLVALPTVVLYAWCSGRRDAAQHGAYAALFSPSVRTARNPFDRRVAIAVREAKLGFRECAGCGFTNAVRTAACVLCGVANDGTATASQKPTAWWCGRAKKNANAGGATPVEISGRQRRIRRRRDWMRQVDDQNRVVWHHSGHQQEESEKVSRAVYVLKVHRQLSLEESLPSPAKISEPIELPNSTEDSSACATAIEIEIVVTEQPSPSRTASASIADVSESLQLELSSTDVAVVAISNANAADVAFANTPPSAIMDHIRSTQLDFPTKLAQFITSMASVFSQSSDAPDTLTTVTRLAIHRETLLHDSVSAVATMSPAEAHAAVRVEFLGEQGIDAGGVYREWFLLLNEAIVKPDAGLFVCVNERDQTFFLNPQSRDVLGEHHLAHFLATGRLLGRALLEGNVTGFHLALPLLKIILGLPVGFEDLAYFDPEAHKNLKWLLENDGVDVLGLDFTVAEKLSNGKTREVELVPGGAQLDVTDANKHEYVDCKLRYLLFNCVESQLFAFLKGLYEVVPAELLVMFDAEELDYVLSGSDEIDVDDWERNTIASENLAYYPADELFWKVVHELSPAERRRLLQFATGSTRVPPGGFGALTSNDGRLSLFTLRGVKATETRGYLHSHACFNRLDLPMHKSLKDMRAAVMAAISSESIGFTTD